MILSVFILGYIFIALEHPLHIDNKLKNNMTAIYYVNTNNGYTRFKNENKIPSEQNKLIIFNTETEHSGTTCTDEPCRIVINFNYYTF